MTREQLIARRIRKGGNAQEAPALLDDLINHFDHGDNLAYALCYWEFATEAQAYRFIATL